MSKNIVEKYKEFNKQLIILISGLSGSGKTELGENMSRDFKIKLMQAKDYYKTDITDTIKLPNGKVVVNYDTDNAIDWDRLNEDINKYKLDGVIVVSHAFPTDKLNFKADYHVHLKISKQKLRDKRMEYIEKHKDKGFDSETELLRINAVTYPYYMDVLKRMKTDKFMDVTEMSDDIIYDKVFDAILDHIKKSVYSEKYDGQKKKKKMNDFDSDIVSPSYSPDQQYIISVQSSE